MKIVCLLEVTLFKMEMKNILIIQWHILLFFIHLILAILIFLSNKGSIMYNCIILYHPFIGADSSRYRENFSPSTNK